MSALHDGLAEPLRGFPTSTVPDATSTLAVLPSDVPSASTAPTGLPRDDAGDEVADRLAALARRAEDARQAAETRREIAWALAEVAAGGWRPDEPDPRSDSAPTHGSAGTHGDDRVAVAHLADAAANPAQPTRPAQPTDPAQPPAGAGRPPADTAALFRELAWLGADEPAEPAGPAGQAATPPSVGRQSSPQKPVAVPKARRRGLFRR